MKKSTRAETIQTLIDENKTTEAIDALLALIVDRQDQPGEHDNEALLAEQLGLSSAAVRAWQLVIRDEPDRADAWDSLATLHHERGDQSRAATCEARAAELLGHSYTPRVQAAPENAAPPQEAFSEADLVRLAHLFSGREGVHARMWTGPHQTAGYSPVRQPLGPDVFRAHLQGALTAGVYLMRNDHTVNFFVIDLDATKDALESASGHAQKTQELLELIHQEGLRLLHGLRALGLDPLLEDSGYKGRHLWCFLPEPTDSSVVREVASRIAQKLAPEDRRLHLELFPKQDRVKPGGLGNLVKLPLGLHLKTGRRCVLLDSNGDTLHAPFSVLRAVRRPALPDPSSLPVARPRSPQGAPLPKPPAPAVVTPSWTAADFETDPEVSVVLEGCGTLRAVIQQAQTNKRLSRDELIVLEHSLGHTPSGVKAINYLIDHLPNVPNEVKMGQHHKGSPVSCRRVRQRLGIKQARGRCDCRFAATAGSYAHPMRYLDSQPKPAPRRQRNLNDLLNTYGRQRELLEQAERELHSLRKTVVAALSDVPGGRWRHGQGEWRVEEVNGLPVLRWAPDA